MTNAFAAFSGDTPLAAHTITRRAPGPTDVAIDIVYCGVCHSDLHFVKGDWGPIPYPAIPGHEIVGHVTAVGSDVTGFKVGDTVGVGCMVDSCRTCPSCQEGLENYCTGGGFVGTYMSVDKHTGGPTYGGYTTDITVDQAFVLRVPANLNLAAAAPLLCAGITTYSPLSHWKVGKGSTVGVVGLGGLGHMGVKIAAAMGAKVTVFTTTPSKAADATALGAHRVVISTDAAAMAAEARTFDFILNTVAASHNLDPFVSALKRDGTMVMVGVPATPHASPSVLGLIMGRRSIAGSLIGGIKETQEMLDFCGEHNIVADIELIPMQEINTAYERMLKSDVKYRFVIEMQSIK
ncbi:MAG: NAD(P)-dependent alcohol dehydrogenase [Gemmatimonadales bacterium]|nr:NAD(P)-dependent alcohol dehydrogenase [Gemmatimonadota bacterium]MBP7622208.1 NAD(P)-dependent alcohol dehydrogenase [Gemmatimonadales bacterium]MBP9897605.1 NAD(P)-dependent alcohol dehydrogenase [Gemmatimonadales bacterium]